MGIRIDRLKCVGCGSCVPVCPVGVLSLVDMKVEVKEGCISCGACCDTCTFHALELEEETAAKKE